MVVLTSSSKDDNNQIKYMWILLYVRTYYLKI